MPIYALGSRVPDIAGTAFVHPDAIVIGDVRIGPESSVWPMARIVGETGVVVIGARTSVQDGAVVCTTQDYGVSIGDDCVVEPLAQVRGASVGHRTLIGSASELEEGVVIERNAAVGAKALITCGTLVPVGTRVSGRPARVGLEKANVELTRGLAGGCVSQGRRYRDQLRQLD